MLAVCGGDGIAIFRGGFATMPDIRLESHDAPVKSIAFSPDGRWLASTSADTTAKLWRLAEAGITAAATLRGHGSSVDAAQFSPDGKWLATGSADHAVRLWQMDSLDDAPRIDWAQRGSDLPGI